MNCNKETLEQHTVLKVLAGSRAYGTDNPESDYDYRSIVLLPPEDLLSFNPFETHQVINGDEDCTYYSLRKAILLLSVCNPHMLEMLWADSPIISNAVGETLVANRKKFLSKQVRYSFLTGAISMMKRAQNSTYYRANYVVHALRLAYACLDIVRTGEFCVRAYDITRLKSIKAGEYRPTIAQVLAELRAIEAVVLTELDTSPLPDKVDRDFVEDLFINITREHICKK